MAGEPRTVVLLAALVAACSAPSNPDGWWQRDVPDGFAVVYHAEHGVGVCGGYGCPTRIIQHTGSNSFCITETDRGTYWEFREQTKCP